MDIHYPAMKMIMLRTHYITIAIIRISYSCILLFYRDASVPYSCTCRRDSYRTLCMRQLTDVSICKFMYSISMYVWCQIVLFVCYYLYYF